MHCRSTNAHVAVTIVLSALLVSLCGCSEGGVAPNNATAPVKSNPIDVWSRATTDQDRLNLLLTPRTVRADQVKMRHSPRLLELSAKLEAAFKDKPLEMLKSVMTSKAGEPLPYNKEFGLSEDEYKEFLRLIAETQPQVIGKVEVTITSTGENTRQMFVKGLPEKYSPLEINTEKLTAKCQAVSLSEPSNVIAKPEQTRTGPWNGYYWRSGFLPAFSGEQTRFYLGQLVESKQVFFQFEFRDSSDPKNSVEVMLRLDPPFDP